jgi:hypothetical protein
MNPNFQLWMEAVTLEPGIIVLLFILAILLGKVRIDGVVLVQTGFDSSYKYQTGINYKIL